MLKGDMEYKRTMVKLPKKLYDSMKLMCVLTEKNMTQFISISIRNQIENLKKDMHKDI